MNRRDIKQGMTVYHRLFTHFGKGTVVDLVPRTALESMFERYTSHFRVLVEFEHAEPKPLRCLPNALRKTPNRKKITDMVAMYKLRGVEAIDAGDKLIIPERNGHDSKQD